MDWSIISENMAMCRNWRVKPNMPKSHKNI